jgi:hypothetical protein
VGRATLHFRDPPGSVEGDAELVFNETGEVRFEVRLDPATLRVEAGEGRDLLPFIQRGRSATAEGRKFTMYSFGDPLNPCSQLEMATREGVLTTEDVGEYTPQITAGDGRDELRLVFELSGAAFDVVGAGPPEYWAVPLLNFVSAFPQNGPATDRHPLRIYQTPVVSANLSNEEQEAALEAANEKNGLILFEFEKRPGFVERLPDYAEREDDLRMGRTRSAATAVIVGE